jgi:type IV pilus assembly protein PilB
MVQSGELPARDLATFCSETFGYPLLDISALNESMLPEKLVELKLIITQKILPIAKKGNKLYLAVSDPTNNRFWIRSNSRAVWRWNSSSCITMY